LIQTLHGELVYKRLVDKGCNNLDLQFLNSGLYFVYFTKENHVLKFTKL